MRAVTLARFEGLINRSCAQLLYHAPCVSYSYSSPCAARLSATTTTTTVVLLLLLLEISQCHGNVYCQLYHLLPQQPRLLHASTANNRAAQQLNDRMVHTCTPQTESTQIIQIIYRTSTEHHLDLSRQMDNIFPMMIYCSSAGCRVGPAYNLHGRQLR